MKIKMLLAGLVTFVSVACGSMQTASGPGMSTSYGSMMDGRSADILAVTFPSGRRKKSDITVRGGKKPNWRQAVGTTEGMSGDSHGVSEWLDFEWREPSYPGLKMKDFPSDEAYSKAVAEKYSKLSIRTQRVFINSRIPPGVVQEVTYSRSHIPKGQSLPETMLWIYFIWTDDGVKFLWKMSCDLPCVRKEGGDEIN